MTAQIIDGKKIAKIVKSEVKTAVDGLVARGGRRPGCGGVNVGENTATAV
jgi:methylenetetrahydrofolate dehydrogenase (NADP+)/methenyltetrahydrofolate cyclohydrolase